MTSCRLFNACMCNLLSSSWSAIFTVSCLRSDVCEWSDNHSVSTISNSWILFNWLNLFWKEMASAGRCKKYVIFSTIKTRCNLWHGMWCYAVWQVSDGGAPINWSVDVKTSTSRMKISRAAGDKHTWAVLHCAFSAASRCYLFQYSTPCTVFNLFYSAPYLGLSIYTKKHE